MGQRKVIIILAVIAVFAFGFTNPDQGDNPTGAYNLFKIERSRDPDIVLYDVNVDSQGNLDTSMPISVYWKKFTENGAFEPLTGIQKRFGYGIKYQNISEHSAEFKFVSSLERIFELRKSGDDHYRVYTYADGKKVEVKSLFIHFEDDAFWFPEISRIEVVGIDIAQGGLINESIIP
jgi:hypothetical protein